MKIIKESKKWSKKIRCTSKGNGDDGCGAILLIEARDLYRTYDCDYNGPDSIYNTFTCPCCKALNDVCVPSYVKVKDKK